MKRRLSFGGIEGLPMILVASNALVFLFEMLQPEASLLPALTLSPLAAQAGEWWRLVTFLFVPPRMSPLFMLLWLYVFYLYAESLEREWGAGKFTLYYGAGALATAAIGFLPLPGIVSNAFLNASLFLAFAALFPDFELLLFFILPVKVKYLGWFTWAWFGWMFFAGDLLVRLSVAGALLPYALFIGPDHWRTVKLRAGTWKRRLSR